MGVPFDIINRFQEVVFISKEEKKQKNDADYCSPIGDHKSVIFGTVSDCTRFHLLELKCISLTYHPSPVFLLLYIYTEWSYFLFCIVFALPAPPIYTEHASRYKFALNTLDKKLSCSFIEVKKMLTVSLAEGWPGYDWTASCEKAAVLELRGVWSTPSLPLLPGPLRSRMVVFVTLPSMGQIDLLAHYLY